MKNNTFSLFWNEEWDNTTTRLYKIEDEIKMYDKETGLWRNSLKKAIGYEKAIIYLEKIPIFNNHNDVLTQVRQLQI